MRRLFLIGLAISCLATSAFGQQPRDGRPVPAAGTARISGVVVSDEQQPKRLRRARVTIRGAEINPPRTVIANDNGTFAFTGLPAGRYTLSATKESYITLNYGAKRPNRVGQLISLKSGESRRVTIRLPRGAVITGSITDTDGTPIAGIPVKALTSRFLLHTNERRLLPAGISVSTTDSRGIYRIYGLPSGDYVVVAEIASDRALTGVRMLSQSEVRQALADAAQPPRQTGRRLPGFGAVTRAEPDNTTSMAADAGPRVTLAPVYYPGTTAAGNARSVTVAAGEERSGIDFALEYIAAATIEGIVVGPDTPRPAYVMLNETGAAAGSLTFRSFSARVEPDGRFRVTDIPPGQYTLLTRSGPVGNEPPNFATLDLIVSGENISGIVLSLQPAFTIGGLLIFQGTTSVPVDAASFLNRSMRFPVQMRHLMATPIIELKDNTFEIRGLAPGPFSMATIKGIRSPIGRWWIRSVVLDGRDILDAPLEFKQSHDNLVLTLSDRASELTGTIVDGQGQPATGHYLVAFGTDRTSWFAGSRRVAGVLADAQGRFTIRNLPAGEYFVVATDDIDVDQWFDAETLQPLAAQATRVTLGDYEKKTHNVVVDGR